MLAPSAKLVLLENEHGASVLHLTLADSAAALWHRPLARGTGPLFYRASAIPARRARRVPCRRMRRWASAPIPAQLPIRGPRRPHAALDALGADASPPPPRARRCEAAS